MQVVLDYETRSEADLKSLGAYEYARHPSTEIICAGIKIDQKPAKLWLPKMGGDKLVDTLLKADQIVVHNKIFEDVITRFVLSKYTDARFEIPHEAWRCSAAKAAMHGLPRDLERASRVLNLATQKDMEGNRLVKKYMKPRTAWKKWREALDLGEAFDWEEPKKYFDDPEELEKIYKYCLTDVETEYLLDKALTDLPPTEREIWRLNQKMNLRGVAVDVTTSRLILSMIESLQKNLTKELIKITGGAVDSAQKRAKFLEWLQANGCNMKTLTADAVKAELTGQKSGAVKRALEIRQALSKSSTKKYEMLLNRAGDTGRVRDLAMYHGAHTGRDSGTGLQVHNLPKGKIKDTDKAIDVVAMGDTKLIELLYGDPFTVFSSVIRGMITASQNHVMYAADFNAIECRVVNYLAGETSVLEDFKSGTDLYVKMAKRVGSESRQYGKTIELACLAGDTKVLTPRGWVCLNKISLTDKIWDGFNWVNHSGLVKKGFQRCINVAGVKLTPDHLLWSRRGWIPAREALKDLGEYQRLVKNLAVSPLSDIGPEYAAGSWVSKCNAIASGLHIWFRSTTSAMENLANAMLALKNQRRIGSSGMMVTLNFCPMMSTGEGSSIALVPPSLGAIAQRPNNMPHTAAEGSPFIKNGEMIGDLFSRISKPLRGGINRTSKWIGSITIKGMRRVISALYLGRITTKINARLKRYKKKMIDSENSCAVYDLAYCGPLNRFTVLSDFGPILVHNCGFGMGADKLRQTSIAWGVNEGRGITDEEADIAVKAYRASHPNVVRFWHQTERAAIRAVRLGGERVKLKNGLEWYLEGRFLKCRLPSGRSLHYFGPEVRRELTPWAEIRPRLYHWHIDSLTKQWICSPTYGGKLVENIVQAVARDIMFEAALRIERHGYKYLMSIHDEIVAESKNGDLKEYESLLNVVPAWAPGLPVLAKGWSGFRFKKS